MRNFVVGLVVGGVITAISLVLAASNANVRPMPTCGDDEVARVSCAPQTMCETP